jgi:adenylate kinase family enzyme
MVVVHAPIVQDMRISIIGNSGSGKSMLARALASDISTQVLDLDLVFWDSGAIERPSTVRIAEVQKFCREHESWIIEGCYSDLIEASFPWRPELIFMDPGQEVCISNCRRRPHEPHKYRTPEEQDQNLDFLLAWVANYYEREGLMSYRSHNELFSCYDGPKRRVTEQIEARQAAT